MKYKIGDVAALLDITSEAIRYYEDHGVISPTKSESTGYRYYGVWDIHILIRARAYRQLGYSLAETAELINSEEVNSIVSTLSKRGEVIEKEIVRNLNLLKHIRQMQEVIVDAEANIGKYRMEYRPAMFRLGGQNGYELRSEPHIRELYQAWIDKVPFVFPSAVFQRGWLKGEDSEFSFGLAVDEEFADFLDIKETEDVTFFSSCLCIQTTILTNSRECITPDNLMPAIEYLHSQGMKLKGDVLSRVVLMKKMDGEYYSWHQLWLPI